MKMTAIQQDFDRCGISPEIVQLDFSACLTLPREVGVYCIWQADRCVYVGQGGGMTGIRGRFRRHYEKAHRIVTEHHPHPQAWIDGQNQDWWTPSIWTLEYARVPSAVHRTYLEGAMMLEFDPFCNDENYADRLSGLLTD